MNVSKAGPEVMEVLQRDTFNYFVHEANPLNGLVIGLLWHLMRQCPYLVTGLRRAGFQGDWLEENT